MFANYINGEWIAAGATFENRNPANTDEVVGVMAKGSAADIAAAADAAAAAFPAWSTMSGPARGNILYKAADILDKEKAEWGRIMTAEMGKPIRAARDEAAKAAFGMRSIEGDHHDGSTDSREYGPIPAGSIVGQPLLRYAPLRRFGPVR